PLVRGTPAGHAPAAARRVTCCRPALTPTLSQREREHRPPLPLGEGRGEGGRLTGEASARLANLLLDAGERGTVVFTGAGVSTESGLPDFRSPGGIWSRYAPIEYADYLRDPELRKESWRRGLESYASIAPAAPNAAHLAIAEWWQAGLVSRVVTQNID